jgi:DNA-binding transcriptional LysR family regulator
MDELARIRTFIKVVDAGSFSAAARDVGSTSSVARQVKSLEDELGVRLLNRNSRGLSLTDAGRTFHQRVSAIANDLGNAMLEAKSLQEDVKGLLRVSLRMTAAVTVVAPALPNLLAQHPDLILDVSLTDERVDLIANGIDVAVWLGELPDADIVARRLSTSRRIVCGSPAYFARRSIPRTPHELRDHTCLVFAAGAHRNRWSFTRDGGE